MNSFWRYKVDHVLFWVVTIAFHAYTRIELVQHVGIYQFLLEIIVRNGLLALLVYTHWLFLIPRYANQKKIVSYVFLLLTSLAFYSLLKNAHDVYLSSFLPDTESRTAIFHNTYYNFSIGLFYLAFFSALQLSKEWYFQKELIQKMELEKLSSELEYLKAQINPHFVFNSINTIYFQIDKNNVHARESLSAFSEMLRYQLYECDGEKISIEKEIVYLKNYVALQRSRKDENYTITFEVGENMKGFTISPLLFIPFVENAFKHVSHLPHANEVKIHLKRLDHALELIVFNTKEKKTMVNGHAGIGLHNVKRRLELLYKDRHKLKIDDRPDSYEVRLTLDLN